MIQKIGTMKVPRDVGTLKVTIKNAYMTPSTNFGVIGSLALYCKLYLGSKKEKTQPDKKHDHNPIWDQQFVFRRDSEPQLTIKVKNNGILNPCKFVGGFAIDLNEVFVSNRVAIKRNLINKGKNVGTLEIELIWEPDHPSIEPNLPFQSYAPIAPLVGGMLLPGSRLSIQASPGSNLPFTGNVILRPATITHQRIESHARAYSNSIQRNFTITTNTTNNIKQPSVNQPPQEAMKKKEEIADPDDKKCIICLDKNKEGVFYTCGHNACCSACGKLFIGKPCPVCRQSVNDFVRVYDT